MQNKLSQPTLNFRNKQCHKKTHIQINRQKVKILLKVVKINNVLFQN